MEMRDAAVGMRSTERFGPKVASTALTLPTTNQKMYLIYGFIKHNDK